MTHISTCLMYSSISKPLLTRPVCPLHLPTAHRKTKCRSRTYIGYTHPSCFAVCFITIATDSGSSQLIRCFGWPLWKLRYNGPGTLLTAGLVRKSVPTGKAKVLMRFGRNYVMYLVASRMHSCANLGSFLVTWLNWSNSSCISQNCWCTYCNWSLG